MTVYVIADIKVTDDSWIPDYAAKAHDVVHRHGGKYLARSGNVRVLEGQPLETTLIAIVAFPDAASAEAFATDADYAPLGAARQALGALGLDPPGVPAGAEAAILHESSRNARHRSTNRPEDA